MPGEERERRLSLPLLQTLSHRRWSPCGDPDLASPSCVAGEMPKTDQRAMETSRQRFPGGKQAAGCHSQGAGRRDTGTLDQLAETWGSGVTVAVWGPELSSPHSSSGSASLEVPAFPFQDSAQPLLSDLRCLCGNPTSARTPA